MSRMTGEFIVFGGGQESREPFPDASGGGSSIDMLDALAMQKHNLASPAKLPPLRLFIEDASSLS